MKKRKKPLTALQRVLIVAVTMVTCAFGLMPRGSFTANWVTWNDSLQAVEFGGYGLAHGLFPSLNVSQDNTHVLQIEVSITPETPSDNNFLVFSQISDEYDKDPLIIGQWQTQLIVMQGYDFDYSQKLPRMTADISDHIGTRTEVKIVLGDGQDQLFVESIPQSTLRPSEFSVIKHDATLSVGNSPNGKNGWRGAVHRYHILMKAGNDVEPTTIRDYDFSSNTLPMINDVATINSYLVVPKAGNFPEPDLLRVYRYQRRDKWQ